MDSIKTIKSEPLGHHRPSQKALEATNGLELTETRSYTSTGSFAPIQPHRTHPQPFQASTVDLQVVTGSYKTGPEKQTEQE